MQSCCVVFLLLLLVATTWAGELRCLRPGAPVIGLYRDGRYFPGSLDGLGESIDVTFQNGQQQSYSSFTNDVIVDDVPEAVELEGGSRVLARRPNSISFEPGFVNGSIKGLPLNDTYLVNFDNGDSIARNIRDIRLAVKPRSCMNEKGIYIGCFENVVNNFLTNYYPVNPTDVATCNWACFTRGFRFAGLQNGTWCFCGNHVNDTLKVDDNDCNIACRDSREDVCGGYQRMTVYWTGAEFENSTDDFSDFSADSKSPLTSEDDLLKTESSTENACADLYDSTQCNTWADQSKCIENPDWMIANCKKSCYACEYNDHDGQDKSDSSPQTYTPDTTSQPQTQDNAYQSPTQSSSAKNSDHPGLDNMSNTPGYLGCFRDSPSSHDLEYLADIRPLSIRACVTKCKSLRFPYAGAQSSSSCYCGLHYGKYGQLEHEDCNTPCEGDSSEMCGGIYKNSLYNTGFPTKFKSEKDSASNSPTKTPPTSPYSESNTADTRPYQTNPSSYYSSQYQQPTYPQQSAGYTPPVYRPPASPYTQATMPGQAGYPQTSYTPSNGYQPGYAYNTQASSGYSNQASKPVLSGATNANTRDYSPADSSSYRWRETYVKLRQQEEARYSKPNLKNLRRLHKSENSQRKNHGNSNDGKQTKGSSNFKTFENNERANSVSQALYGQLMSQMKKPHGSISGGNSKIPGKGAKPQHHKFEKPGVFLRKKASKKNSFLAFLPHEVTENESLLQNVYNMLSVMLKNLRKHKKSSLKNLRKYLKFTKSNAQNPEFSKKAPLHAMKHKESVDRSENPAFERKVDGLPQSQTSKSRGPGIRGKAQKTSSSHLREMDKNNLSEGQKQLSKIEKGIPNSGEQMPLGQTLRSASRDTRVKTYASRANGSQSMRPSKNSVSNVNYNRGDAKPFKNTVQPRHKDAKKLSQSQPSEDVSRKAPQVKGKLPSSWQSHAHVMPSRVSRNLSEVVSKNESQTKSRVDFEDKSEAQKVSKHESGVQKITNSHDLQPPGNVPKNESNFQHVSKQESSFKNGSSEANAALKKKLVKESSPKYTENAKETLKTEKSWPKTKSKTKLEANSTITNNEMSEDTMERKSDEDIISTIVNMIEKEKAARSHSSERELNDGKRRHGNAGGKRKQKRHSRSRKHKTVKEKRKRKLRHSKRKSVSDMKRIYKKDHVERVMDEDKANDDDDNLMVEDEYFRKKNKISE